MIYAGKFKVTSPFGWRVRKGQNENHKGIDVVGLENKYICAVVPGTVGSSTIITDKANTTWEWGNYVRIDGDDGRKYFYCHMSQRLVSVGQRVKVGDLLGVEGNTGKSDGSHCHFEVRENGTSINPAPFLGVNNAVGVYTKTTLEDDLNILVKHGVINTPGYWRNNAPKLEYLTELIHNMAEVLRK